MRHLLVCINYMYILYVKFIIIFNSFFALKYHSAAVAFFSLFLVGAHIFTSHDIFSLRMSCFFILFPLLLFIGFYILLQDVNTSFVLILFFFFFHRRRRLSQARSYSHQHWYVCHNCRYILIRRFIFAFHCILDFSFTHVFTNNLHVRY